MSQVYTFQSDIVGDLHKDAYGFRPSQSFWQEWNQSGDAERQQIWDNLLVSLDAEIQRERLATEQAVSKFEELIVQTIQSGAKDRDTAIRWIFEAGDFHDYEEMEFHYNLPFGTFQKVA